MDILQYTLWSVSIAATLMSIVFVVALITGFHVMKRLNRIFNQLDAMTQTGLATSKSVQAFVNQTTHQISAFTQAFLTMQGAKEIISHVGESIQKFRQNGKEKA